jgi:hypothetical protein
MWVFHFYEFDKAAKSLGSVTVHEFSAGKARAVSAGTNCSWLETTVK